MKQGLYYKMGTTIAIDRQRVLDFFNTYISHSIASAPFETYLCREGSLLVLVPGDIKENVFVQFLLNLNSDKQEPGRELEGKIWFMKFCKQHNSWIKNLRSGTILPVSDGAIMSDMFSSRSFKIAQHQLNHPKDKQSKGK